MNVWQGSNTYKGVDKVKQQMSAQAPPDTNFLAFKLI